MCVCVCILRCMYTHTHTHTHTHRRRHVSWQAQSTLSSVHNLLVGSKEKNTRVYPEDPLRVEQWISGRYIIFYVFLLLLSYIYIYMHIHKDIFCSSKPDICFCLAASLSSIWLVSERNMRTLPSNMNT